MGLLSLVTGNPRSSGFGSASTAEVVTRGIDASNLTAIVTGGASGIGMETARVLALRGAHVIIGSRNVEAGKAAINDILRQTKGARVDVLPLDLSSMESVKKFANDFQVLNLPLNILMRKVGLGLRSWNKDLVHATTYVTHQVEYTHQSMSLRNNAGVMLCPFKLSKDGIEMQFATNHVGHFLLTNLLLDKMKMTARGTGVEGRVVNISSSAHFFTYDEGIRFNRINDENGYSDYKAYGQSKLANILHANELSRRLKEEGANVTANSVHPGCIMTNLMQHSRIRMRILNFFTAFLWKNVPQGAATTCYVALHPDLNGVGGKYFADCNEVNPSMVTQDKDLALKLWEFSMGLVNSALGV